jgi:hypothetical protein
MIQSSPPSVAALWRKASRSPSLGAFFVSGLRLWSASKKLGVQKRPMLLLAGEVHRLARDYCCVERNKDLDGYDEATRAKKLVEWEQANPFTKFIEKAYLDFVKVVIQMREIERDYQMKKKDENLISAENTPPRT